jgi:hypothetical protein
MPPTADATLLPPPHDYGFADDLADDRGSSRSLDEIGAVTVLGAMVEQRRRSRPAACEVSDDLTVDDDEDDSDVVATQRRPAVDPTCDAFMKIR